MEWTLTIDSASSSTSSTAGSSIVDKTEAEIEEDVTSIHTEEAGKIAALVEEAKKGSVTEFDKSFTPFTLRWSFGRNIHVPFINLTQETGKRVFYTSAHVGIIYNYEEKTMMFLQGHQNIITSITSDKVGKWIATADAGKDSVIIVWDSETFLPVRTIFDPHGRVGTRLVGMSLEATYLVSVSDDRDQQIACWMWTLGETKPNGVHTLTSQYGKIHHIAFQTYVESFFVLTAESCVVFGEWHNSILTVYVQEKIKRAGKLLCSVYQNNSHYVFTTTDNGYLMMWSDVPFSSVYNMESIPLNKKTLLKVLKLEEGAIPVIKAYHELMVTGNAFGEIRFYDRMMKILYWVQSFNLHSITAIHFHLWYPDPLGKGKVKTVGDLEMDPFGPFAALEKAFDKVLQKEKEKLAELKLLTQRGVKYRDGPNALEDELVNTVLEEVEKWNMEDFANKEEYIEAIIKFTIAEMEKKYSIALVQTEKLIEGFVSSVLQELEEAESVTQGDAREVAHSVIHEILQSLSADAEKTPSTMNLATEILDDIIDPPVGKNVAREVLDDVLDPAGGKNVAREVLDDVLDPAVGKNVARDVLDDVLDPSVGKNVAREVLDDVLDAPDSEMLVRGLLDEILGSPNAKMLAREVLDDILETIEGDASSTRSILETVVSNVVHKMEDKLTIDPQKIVESVVSNLLKHFEKKSQRDLKMPEREKRPPLQIYDRLQKLINQAMEAQKAAGVFRAPSDATLQRRPFMVGDFIISTVDGDIGLVNFLKNSYVILLDKCVSPITALDCHLEKQQFAVGNKIGNIILYNFQKTQIKLLESDLPSTGDEVSVTSLKFAPSGFYLACGLSDGSLWIVDPSVLTPLTKTPHFHVNAPINQICISDDSAWIAHKDEGMRVCLYRCDDPTGAEVEFMGKQKTHFKPIRDLMFTRSLEEELHLFSLGEDRMLVEYDLVHSEPDDLKVLLIERIEQSAIPHCMTMYPKFGVENFILIANSEYKFKIFNDDSRMCRKTALGPRFERPVTHFSILPKRGEKNTQYMVYACEKLIGIQMLPLDGNPYKAVGMIGHPRKITHMSISSHNRNLFTTGQDDHAIFMWTINTRAVDIISHIGGEGLNPYYCLIEGGESGWLFKEIEDFFYYAQILHEGENTTSERNVTSEIPLCEVPDLMRAIGFFPSEHEIGNMLHEIQFWSYSEIGKHQKNIGFEDFVKLYVNHQPAFGTKFSKLKEAFETFADDTTPDGPMMWRETLTSMLQERAECLSQEQVVKYLQVLIPSGRDVGSSSSSSSTSEESLWEFIPEVITYKVFLDDILGISPAEDKKDPLLLREKEQGKKQDKTTEDEDAPDDPADEFLCNNVECI